MFLNSELSIKSITVIVFRLIGAILTYFMMVLIARLIGVSEFGAFNLGLTIFVIVGMLSRFGMESVILKNFSRNYKADLGLALGYLHSSIKILIIIGVVFSILLFQFSEIISISFFDSILLSEVIPILSVGIIPMSFLLVVVSAIKSINHPIVAAIIQSIIVPTIAIVCIAMLWIYDAVNLTNIVFSYIFSIVICSLALFLLYRKLFFLKNNNSIAKKELLEQGWPMLLVSSGALIMTWADILSIGVFLGDESVGIYSAASRTAIVMSLIAVGINSITSPKFSNLYANGEADKLKNLAKKSTLLSFWMAVPVSVVTIWQSDNIMLLFGEEFNTGVNVLIILIISQAVNVMTGPVAALLAMTGKETSLMAIMMLASIINILLNIILIPNYGLIGAAIATLISSLIWNILSMIKVKEHLGFWTVSMPILNFK